jgi:hypothetical protein
LSRGTVAGRPIARNVSEMERGAPDSHRVKAAVRFPLLVLAPPCGVVQVGAPLARAP